MSTEADELPVAESEWCIGCDIRVPLDHLLEVTEVRTGGTFFVHRPGGRHGGICFRQTVGPASVHRVKQQAAGDRP